MELPKQKCFENSNLVSVEQVEGVNAGWVIQ